MQTIGVDQLKHQKHADDVGSLAQPTKTLWVGNLPNDSDLKDKLMGIFTMDSEKPEIILKKSPRGSKKGYAFVNYSNVSTAIEALKKVEGTVIGGKRVLIHYQSLHPSKIGKAALWVGSIPSDFKHDDLIELFKPYGNNAVSPIRNTSRGAFAFVNFSSELDAQRAFSDLNGFNVGSGSLVVHFQHSSSTSTSSSTRSRSSSGSESVSISSHVSSPIIPEKTGYAMIHNIVLHSLPYDSTTIVHAISSLLSSSDIVLQTHKQPDGILVVHGLQNHVFVNMVLAVRGCHLELLVPSSTIHNAYVAKFALRIHAILESANLCLTPCPIIPEVPNVALKLRCIELTEAVRNRRLAFIDTYAFEVAVLALEKSSCSLECGIIESLFSIVFDDLPFVSNGARLQVIAALCGLKSSNSMRLEVIAAHWLSMLPSRRPAISYQISILVKFAEQMSYSPDVETFLRGRSHISDLETMAGFFADVVSLEKVYAPSSLSSTVTSVSSPIHSVPQRIGSWSSQTSSSSIASTNDTFESQVSALDFDSLCL
eukprot:TRINITY_DN4496_c0_g1_i1.p1 TRINITY_DN4496_c0_g1~~TRINITY_DN4496_c0_g1_i1.p1  ORF type:complete len:539 (-),score=144.25 TRINITY_DN4496_c0_g1_i1:306-1922(-)